MKTSKPNILFMGSPDFATANLEALYKAGFPIVGVFTQPDKPAGRGKKLTACSCALFAREHSLNLYQPASLKSDEVLELVKSLEPDIIITAAYGYFLPQAILESAKSAALNVHGSLLPHYRGAAPVQWALMNGEKKTGISIIAMVAQMDAGPIYDQYEVMIDDNDNTQSLMAKLAQTAAAKLPDTITAMSAGKLTPQEQDESLVSFAPQLKKTDGQLNWDQPATKIRNLIRGLTPWPSAYTMIDKKNLKIYDSAALDKASDQAPGTICAIGEKGFAVACKQSQLLVTEVQLEGKKRMPASDFARGFRLQKGTQLL